MPAIDDKHEFLLKDVYLHTYLCARRNVRLQDYHLNSSTCTRQSTSTDAKVVELRGCDDDGATAAVFPTPDSSNTKDSANDIAGVCMCGDGSAAAVVGAGIPKVLQLTIPPQRKGRVAPAATAATATITTRPASLATSRCSGCGSGCGSGSEGHDGYAPSHSGSDASISNVGVDDDDDDDDDSVDVDECGNKDDGVVHVSVV